MEKMNPSTKGRMQFCGPGGRASPSTPLPPSYQTKKFHFSLHLSIHQPLPPSKQTHPKYPKWLTQFNLNLIMIGLGWLIGVDNNKKSTMYVVSILSIGMYFWQNIFWYAFSIYDILTSITEQDIMLGRFWKWCSVRCSSEFSFLDSMELSVGVTIGVPLCVSEDVYSGFC